jgi:hypothetical protein
MFLLQVCLWLDKGKISPCVGNGESVVVLNFSNRLILELKIFYFILVLSRNIVSISYLALNWLKNFIWVNVVPIIIIIIIMFTIDLVIIQMVCIYLI